MNREDVADDLPRVLLENYLLLAAGIENQNKGRLPDMLQYCQKVHHNLVQVMQQIDDAPTLAMPTDNAVTDAGQDADQDKAELEQVEEADAVPEDAADAMFAEAETYSLEQQHYLPAAALPHSQSHFQRQQQQQSIPCQQQHQLLPLQPHQQQAHSVLTQMQGGMPRHPQHQQQQQQLPAAPSLGMAPGPGPTWLRHVNESVDGLLSSLGLAEFAPLLEEQKVDMAALQLMEERHLREMGLPIGAVVKIKAALAAAAL